MRGICLRKKFHAMCLRVANSTRSLSASQALRKETADVGPAVQAGPDWRRGMSRLSGGVIFFDFCCTFSTARRHECLLGASPLQDCLERYAGTGYTCPK